MFQNFDEALDTFLVRHGYTGDRQDIDGKMAFIKSRFEQKQIPLPRNIRKWYTEHKRIKKETAIRICFAFGLTVEESELIRILSPDFHYTSWRGNAQDFGAKLVENKIIRLPQAGTG